MDVVGCVVVVYILLDGWGGVWKCGCVVEWMVDGVGSSGWSLVQDEVKALWIGWLWCVVVVEVTDEVKVLRIGWLGCVVAVEVTGMGWVF